MAMDQKVAVRQVLYDVQMVAEEVAEEESEILHELLISAVRRGVGRLEVE